MAMTPGVQSIGLKEETNQVKSILEMNDLQDFLGQAEMAHREFASEKEQFVVIDSTGTQYRPGEPHVSWADETTRSHKKDDFSFAELSVPRRPAWDSTTTPQQLDRQENDAFLEWRRRIAEREEVLLGMDDTCRVTPFEKNLEVWRQLWRVLERATCVVQIVDARNPLFYLSKDLKQYATEELGKPMVLLVNKSDYLSSKQRQEWHLYLESQGWNHIFFSAHMEQAKLDAEAAAVRRQHDVYDRELRRHEQDVEDEGDDDEESEGSREPSSAEEEPLNSTADSSAPRDNDSIGVQEPLSRHELIDWLHNFAVQRGCEPDSRFDNRIQFGMVGFPNVGKSSVINVLVGSSKHAHGVVRVGVAAQPGKTKHFQTLLLPDRDDVMLCDCPGLVFPSFVSNTADLIAAGVYPIAQMRDHWPVVGLICRRIPREILNAVYGIQLPVPTAQELLDRGYSSMEGNDFGNVPPPTAEELLSTFCVARSMLSTASGVPDYQQASRVIIKDYASGKLLYCHKPPTFTSEGNDVAVMDETEFHTETVLTTLRNTKKLRDKLNPLMEQFIEPDKSIQTETNEDIDIGFEDDLDMDILEVMEGLGGTGEAKGNGGKRGKKHKSMQKHGRKGRRDRNKDPYGCHSTPDDTLIPGGSSAGLVVNAGKYGRKGYTRPTTYAGARGATRLEK